MIKKDAPGRFCTFIVEKWKLFSILFLALLIMSVILLPRVKVIFSMAAFLPEESPTSKALSVNTEFGDISTAEVLINDIDGTAAQLLSLQLMQIDGVLTATTGTGSDYVSGNRTLIKVVFNEYAASDRTQRALSSVRSALDQNYSGRYIVGGSAVSPGSFEKQIANEMMMILLVAIPVIFLILLLTSKSFIEPAVFAVVIGFAAVINMGTNFFIPGGISYITHSIAVVLQLALAMDYAIIFLHRYTEQKRLNNTHREAIAIALRKSFTSISASCLTTVAGLVALMFMQLGIGFDIGIVLAKGVVISMLAVFFFMPGILLLFAKAIDKTAHRPFLPKMRFISSFNIVVRKFMPFVMIPVIVASFFVQRDAAYTFSDGFPLSPEDEQIIELFGKTNPLAVLVPKGDLLKEKQIIDFAENFDIVTSAQGMSTLPFHTPVTAAETVLLLNGLTAALPWEIEISVSQVQAIFDSYNAAQGTDLDAIPAIDLLRYAASYDTGLPAPLDKPFAGVSEIADTMLSNATAAFESEHYNRILFNLDTDSESKLSHSFVKALRNKLKTVYPESYILGDAAFIYDMSTSFNSDVLKISLLTIILIFVILLFSFRSAIVPPILLTVIAGAVYINFSISALTGSPILFIGYLLVSAMQMGATIDYAILLSTRYIEARRREDKFTAIRSAVSAALPTVLTSGGIMVTAGYVVSFISTTDSIGGLGSLLGRGALVSIVLVLFFLPQLLLLLDKAIAKTTYRSNFLFPKSAAQMTAGYAEPACAPVDRLAESTATAVAEEDSFAEDFSEM